MNTPCCPPGAVRRYLQRCAICLAPAIVALLLPSVAGAYQQESAAIFTMKPDGSDVKLLVKLPDKVWNGSPSWSADGKRMAFDASPVSRGGPASHVYVCEVRDPQGTAKDLGSGNSPTWSPDGEKLAFFTRDANIPGEQGGIWMMKADGTDRKRIGHGERPRWSPDGLKISCASNQEGFWSLYVIGPGGQKRVLQDDFNRVIGGSWSPDNKQLAFLGYRDGHRELGIVNIAEKDGAPRIRLKGNYGGVPQWSPDGKLIVLWQKGDEGAQRLVLVSPVGNDDPKEIAGQDDTYINSDPCWSPDSGRIAFISDR